MAIDAVFKLLYSRECWPIFSDMVKGFETIKMRFYRKTPRLQWTEHVGNDEVLDKMKTRRKLVFNIWKRQFEIQGYMMSKETWKI